MFDNIKRITSSIADIAESLCDVKKPIRNYMQAASNVSEAHCVVSEDYLDKTKAEMVINKQDRDAEILANQATIDAATA